MKPMVPRPHYGGIAETHSGVVVFLADRAYKFKKPVNLGFLDFSKIEARRAACEREVTLNSRLAPDVYLGVGELRDPDSDVGEPAVVMRRLPADRRLSSLVNSGVDLSDHLRRLARQLVEFHIEARRGADINYRATAKELAAQWHKHLVELRDVSDGLVAADVVDRVEALALRYLYGRGHLFADRIRQGWICDGHGDLLADDIFCLDDQPRVLDCLDFDEKLRWADVLADITFLMMDLERLGRPDLAAQLLADYDEFSGEVHPHSLVHHYLAYRSSVRCKVAAIRHRQVGDRHSVEEVHQLAAITLDHLDAAHVRLVLIGGLPGTGKSTLADALGRSKGWVVLSSDVVRKELAGLTPQTSAAAGWREGIYGPETSRAAYRALLARATAALHMGESVVLDASWCDAKERAVAVEVARRASADCVELACVTDASIAEQRITRRAADKKGASDATTFISKRMIEVCDVWPTAHAIDTTCSVEDSLQQVRRVLDGRSTAGHEIVDGATTSIQNGAIELGAQSEVHA